MQKLEGQPDIDGGAPQRAVTVVGAPKTMRYYARKFWIPIALVFVLACLLALVFVGRSDKPKTVVSIQQKTVCTDVTIGKAAGYIAESNSYELGRLVEKEVTNKADYQQDINCLYIVISYNFSNNVATGIDLDIDNYTELYVQGVRPSSNFGTTLSAAEVKQQAAAIDKVNEAYEKQNSEATEGDSIVGEDGVYPQ